MVLRTGKTCEKYLHAPRTLAIRVEALLCLNCLAVSLPDYGPTGGGHCEGCGQVFEGLFPNGCTPEVVAKSNLGMWQGSHEKLSERIPQPGDGGGNTFGETRGEGRLGD